MSKSTNSEKGMRRMGLGCVLALVVLAVAAQDNEVQQLADRWANAYNTHDAGALGGVYTEDARLMMHGLPTVVGRDKISAYWVADFVEGGNPRTILTVTNSVTGVDMILVHGNYQVVDSNDASKVLGSGRFAHIWIKDGNSDWKLDRDLWNQPYESPAFGN